MYRHAFSGLEPGSQVWIAPSGQYLSTRDRWHAHTALELEPLRDLLGNDAEAWRVDFDNGSMLTKRLRDYPLSHWLARQLDALLRRGDRWAHEVERVCEAQLGPLMTGPTNPADGWRGATGRLRGIAPGATGLQARRTELIAEAQAYGFGEPITGRRGRRIVVVGYSGPAPMHFMLHGCIALAAVALWDLGIVRQRLRAKWPAGLALTSLVGLSRGSGRAHRVGGRTS